MSEQAYRSIFAILGLAVGLGLMMLLGLGGMIPGAIFGAGGAVLGGMTGEQIARRSGAK